MNRRRMWWTVGAAGVALVALGTVLVVSLNRSGTTQPAAAEPVATSAQPSAAPSQTTTPTAEAKPTNIPVAQKSAYCKAYDAILHSQPSTSDDDDDTLSDAARLKQLSATFGKLITLYSTAQKFAPAALKDDYAVVVRYQKDFKITADTGDWNAVGAQLRQLDKLNGRMDTIQSRSQQICG